MLPVIWYTKHCPLESNHCYVYHYILQIFGATLMFFNIIGFDGFTLAVITVAYCELEKIKISLSDMKDDANKTDDENMRKITELVKKHCIVLNFIKNINNEFSTILMHQLAATLTGVCTGIYFLMLFQNDLGVVLRFVPYLLSILVQMFLYSVAGELIATQTQSIHFAAYDTNWHLKHQPKTTKALCMMMLRSQKPDEIIAGMWTWNMRIFLSVTQNLLQTGFSMFTFMKTVQSK
nr:odorant receptor 82a-like [Onthophagus taurus]